MSYENVNESGKIDQIKNSSIYKPYLKSLKNENNSSYSKQSENLSNLRNKKMNQDQSHALNSNQNSEANINKNPLILRAEKSLNNTSNDISNEIKLNQTNKIISVRSANSKLEKSKNQDISLDKQENSLENIETKTIKAIKTVDKSYSSEAYADYDFEKQENENKNEIENSSNKQNKKDIINKSINNAKLINESYISTKKLGLNSNTNTENNKNFDSNNNYHIKIKSIKDINNNKSKAGDEIESLKNSYLKNQANNKVEKSSNLNKADIEQSTSNNNHKLALHALELNMLNKSKSFISEKMATEAILNAATPPPDKASIIETKISKLIKFSSHKTDEQLNLINFKEEKKPEVKNHQGSQALDPNAEKSEFSISFATEPMESFEKKYSEFLCGINQEQKKAFKTQENIADYLKGFNPKIIKAMNKSNQLTAICCVQYDQFFDSTLRLYITNMLCLEYEKFGTYAVAFLEFIISHFICQEIYVDLYYEYNNGNFTVNNYILDILKKSLGFKWTKLENKITERFQKLCIKLNSSELIYYLPYPNSFLPASGNTSANQDSLSKNFSAENKHNSSAIPCNKKRLKNFKCNLQIISSSTISLKNGSHDYNISNYCQNPADAGNCEENNNNIISQNNFESDVNLFLVLHTLLNLKQVKAFKAEGEYINKLDYERISVITIINFFSDFLFL